MPAFGVGTPIFLVVQALLSRFVYSEAKKSGYRSPIVVGISVFVIGVGFAFVFSTVIELVIVEIIIILIYFLVVQAAKQRPPSA